MDSKLLYTNDELVDMCLQAIRAAATFALMIRGANVETDLENYLAMFKASYPDIAHDVMRAFLSEITNPGTIEYTPPAED